MFDERAPQVETARAEATALRNVRIGSTTLRRFQVLGERCSGTNYLRTAIANGTTLKSEPLAGWKHGFPTFAALPDDFLLVCVVRNAFDWVTSFFQRPWHTSEGMRELDLASFVRAPWDSVVDDPVHFNLPPENGERRRPLQYDRHPITGLPFRNVAHLRNVKLAGWAGIANRRVNVAYTRLEDWKGLEAERLDELAGAFDLERLAPRDVTDTHFGFAEDWRERHAFLARTGRSPCLNAADRAFLRSELDIHQEARFGYVYDAP